MPMSTLLDDDAVRDALRQVEDPEAGMNIVDLGLIYGIAIEDKRIDIEMTMTTAACPMAEMIVDQAHAAVAGIVPAVVEVAVHLVWDPPWTPDRMSGIARDHFGWLP
jgi:metal-sulfur cluster biosynthetic enzyme